MNILKTIKIVKAKDSNYIVDEENLLDDPEVDKKNFHLNIDKKVGWVGSFLDVRDKSAECDAELKVIDTEVLLSASSLKKIKIYK